MDASCTRRLAPALVLLSVSIALAATARAEAFVDVYAGWSNTSDTKTVVSPSSFGGGGSTHGESFSVGLRGGYWFETLPWLGIAGDVSYFKPDASLFFFAEDIDVTPLSALLMLRAPLFKSDEFPNGRLQPYGGIGPGLFITSYSEDLIFAGGRFEDTQVDVGLDVRAGGEVLLLDWLGLFVEYRYTWVEPEWEDQVGGVRTSVRTELGTHHFQGGVGFHF